MTVDELWEESGQVGDYEAWAFGGAPDKLADLVAQNFQNVKYENGMLMTIESLTTPADWSSFISILINGEMSQKGIMEMEFKDGDKIDFVDTVYIPMT